jgi:glycosyltransferase involved in cell wall biosynthesis
MRLAILWTALSGYMNACLKELSTRENVELFVCHQLPAEDAPFHDGQFAWLSNRMAWRVQLDLRDLPERLRAFSPDVMIIPSWHVPMYRRAGRDFANRCWRVMAMDNPWQGSLKQRLGILVSPLYLKPMTDVVWLPGERQAMFARKLGFPQSKIMRGIYSCDHAAFEAVHLARIQKDEPLPRRFVFIGRLVEDKCVDKLARAYRLYRERYAVPWPLTCCGSGPMKSLLEKEDGIEMAGFVQPDRIPQVLASAACLILPSRFEPWALVVHEAAAAGRLILASENVGAVPHLVQPGYNGFIFSNEDVAGLAALMSRVSAMGDARLDAMSRASYMLSKQFSPRRWADTLLESFHARSTTS